MTNGLNTEQNAHYSSRDKNQVSEQQTSKILLFRCFCCSNDNYSGDLNTKLVGIQMVEESGHQIVLYSNAI